MASLEVDPVAEAQHLRRLLETQPGCLMWVGADGEVLAANEASLRLLGVELLADARGKPITTWLLPDQHSRWASFSAQVIDGSPASIECDLQTASGEGRAVLFHGVSLTDHPDGLASMALSARDVMDRRQLEQNLGEVAAERARLAAAFDAERAQVRQGLDALRTKYLGELKRATRAAALRQAEETRAEHAEVLRGLESQRLDLQAQLDQALADRHRVESAARRETVESEALQDPRGREEVWAAIEQSATALGRLTAERDALQQKLDGAESHSRELAEALRAAEARHQQVVEELARDTELARSALQARLDEAVMDCRRLEAALQARETASGQAPGAPSDAGTDAGRGALARTAADQSTALHALAEQVRRLSLLDTAGGAGGEMASELRRLVRGADGAATRLLAVCPIDHPCRPDVERLRADAIQAAALAGELLLASGGPDDPRWAACRGEFPGRSA